MATQLERVPLPGETPRVTHCAAAVRERRRRLDLAIGSIRPIYSPAEMAALDARPDPGFGKPSPLSDADCEFSDLNEWLQRFRKTPVSRPTLAKLELARAETGMVGLREVAGILGLKLTSIQAAACAGRIPARKLHGVWVADPEAVRAAVEARKRESEKRSETRQEQARRQRQRELAEIEAREGLVTLKHAAELTGVPANRISGWCTRALVGCTVVGRLRLVDPEVVRRYAEQWQRAPRSYSRDQEGLVTQQRAMELVGVSATTLRAWISRGLVQRTRNGHYCLVNLEQVRQAAAGSRRRQQALATKRAQAAKADPPTGQRVRLKSNGWEGVLLSSGGESAEVLISGDAFVVSLTDLEFC